MILFSTNRKLSDPDSDKLWSTVDRPTDSFTTSYSKNDKDLTFLLPFYGELISDGMTHLNLESRVTYNYVIWYQCYNKKSTTHGVHDHYSGDEILSWVHVISTGNDKCFYFVIDGQKVYPECQKDGDFFMFPSWMLHGVDTVKDDGDRLIVAGNVALSFYHGTEINLHFKNTEHHKIITKTKL